MKVTIPCDYNDTRDSTVFSVVDNPVGFGSSWWLCSQNRPSINRSVTVQLVIGVIRVALSILGTHPSLITLFVLRISSTELFHKLDHTSHSTPGTNLNLPSETRVCQTLAHCCRDNTTCWVYPSLFFGASHSLSFICDVGSEYLPRVFTTAHGYTLCDFLILSWLRTSRHASSSLLMSRLQASIGLWSVWYLC